MDSLIIRPAHAEDREAVLAFTTNTWDWGDYIAYVWDTWLADPQGELTVAELAGSVVGLTMSTFLCPGEGWLQGLRVHPDHRRLGLARRLTSYQLDLMRRWRVPVVRLAVHSPNAASQTHVAHTGFRRLGTFIVFERDVDASASLDESTAQPVPAGETDRVWDAVRSSATFAAAAGLWATGWAWQTLTHDKLAAAIAAGSVLGVRSPSGPWEGVAISYLDDDTLHTAYVDGDAAALAALAHALLGRARQLGAKYQAVVTPPVPAICEAFRRAGYGGSEGREGAMYIYELSL